MRSRDSIDHGPHGHAYLANAVAGAAAACNTRATWAGVVRRAAATRSITSPALASTRVEIFCLGGFVVSAMGASPFERPQGRRRPLRQRTAGRGPPEFEQRAVALPPS